MGAADVSHAGRRATVARHPRRRCASGHLSAQAARLLAPGPVSLRPAADLLSFRPDRTSLRRRASWPGDQAGVADGGVPMKPQIRAKLLALGPDLSPVMLQETTALMA